LERVLDFRRFRDCDDSWGKLMNRRSMLTSSVAATLLIIGMTSTAHALAPAATDVVRFAGADRYATSAAIVAASYSAGVPVAYVASGENFPDALAGGAAAARDNGPLLLVRHDGVPADIATELGQLRPASVVVLGGTASVAPTVVTALQSFTSGAVTRVAGADRYATAASLADTFAIGAPVYVASGTNYPDALAATAAAAVQHAAILLTSPSTLPPSTAAALSRLQPSSITIVGGTSAVSAGVETSLGMFSSSVVRISGADRYATASAIAAHAFPSATAAFIATGASFADALSGGPVAGKLGQPLLLSTAACLPTATFDEVNVISPEKVTLLGGTSSLGAGVQSLSKCVAPPPPPPPPTTPIAFGNGIHQVGPGLPAGTYRTRANATGCYWARLSGFSGELTDILANGISNSRVVVTIEPGDVGFESDNCGTWTNDLSAVTSSLTAPFSDGQYIVGTDISAGTWSAPGGPQCYWEREADFSGGTSSIIANDVTVTNPIVTISSSDAGFKTDNCGTWSRT
jgi:putative cell wall-binding protein